MATAKVQPAPEPEAASFEELPTSLDSEAAAEELDEMVKLTAVRLTVDVALPSDNDGLALVARRNGAEVWRDAAVARETTDVRLEIPLESGVNRIEVVAETEGHQHPLVKTRTDIGIGRLSSPPAPPSAARGVADVGANADQTNGKATLYILSVGVSKLTANQLGASDAGPAASLKDLKYAAADAHEIGRRFAAMQGGLFGEVVAQVLTDEAATKDGILSAIGRLKRDVASRTRHRRDVTLVFLAGHGVTHMDDFYFVSSDFAPDDITNTAVSLSEVGALFSDLRTEVVVLIDACNSGEANADWTGKLNPEQVGQLLRGKTERTVYLVASTRHDQLSYEYRFEKPYYTGWGSTDGGHGLYTHAILKTLKAADGSVGLLGLVDDIQEQLAEWRRWAGWSGIRQTPTFRSYGDDDHLVIYES